MRYHITSLVAVFLALAVGIVLGTAIVNKGIVERQQSALVSSLRSEFGSLRERNRALQEQANHNEQFFQNMLPLLIDKRLAGKRIAVVSTSANDAVRIRPVVTRLTQAGATVSVITIARQDLGVGEPSMAVKLQKIFVREKLKGEELRQRLIAEVATQVASLAEPAFLDQLAQIGVMQITGADRLPADGIVFIAGSSPKTMIEKVQVPLLERVRRGSVIVVGAEATDVKESVVPLYQDRDISTVDNAESPIGQFSIVMALSGRAGHYGVKDTADVLAPRLESR